MAPPLSAVNNWIPAICIFIVSLLTVIHCVRYWGKENELAGLDGHLYVFVCLKHTPSIACADVQPAQAKGPTESGEIASHTVL